jgi:hypothetical protein
MDALYNAKFLFCVPSAICKDTLKPMQVLLGLLLLHASMALPVFYLEGNELDYALSPNSLVHVQFPASCDRNCRASFVLKAPAGALELSILVDPRAEPKLIVAMENSAALQPSNKVILDSACLIAYRQAHRLSETLAEEKVLVVTVLGNSLEARFAILVGPQSFVYDFWQLTVGFAPLVQQRRLWSKSFALPYVALALLLLYFLAWPLRRRRPHAQTILSSMASLSLLSWVVDAFWHYFLVRESTDERGLSSFLLQVLGNLVFVFVLLQTQGLSMPVRRGVCLSVGLLSLLNGGAGFYCCPVFLALELLFLEQGGARRGRNAASLVCKAV